MEISLRILCEIGLIEIEDTGDIEDTTTILFQMFLAIKYLKIDYE